MDVNKVILLGRLVKDPVAKTLPTGQEISQFSVATNYLWRDAKSKQAKEKVEYHNVVLWGRLAKVANQYLSKGGKVYLEGKLANRNWIDKNGQKHYRTEVVGSEMNLLGGSKKTAKRANDLVPEDITIEEVPIENN